MKNSSGHRKRILIVEDEESICIVCQRVLTGEGFEVDFAANGLAGKAKIDEQKYDLYLFDIKMPLMSGKELYEWLEEAHPGSTKKVLFITGSVVGDDTFPFLQHSGRPVLYKPFSPHELKGMVKACLGEG